LLQRRVQASGIGAKPMPRTDLPNVPSGANRTWPDRPSACSAKSPAFAGPTVPGVDLAGIRPKNLGKEFARGADKHDEALTQSVPGNQASQKRMAR